MKIACLMGTYGRYRLACESLASFLQQTALADATLLILNQHPIPLSFDHPRVRVVNEQMPGVGIRRIRMRMVELAPENADYVHWWDDDDLYLPWHLDDCLTHAPGHLGWKPARSWMYRGPGRYELMENYFEASVALDARFIRSVQTDTYPGYPEHPAFQQLRESGQLATTELGDLSSFLCRWDTGIPHHSFSQFETQELYDRDMDRFRSELTDAGPTEMVVPDLWPHWRAFAEGVKDQVSPDNHVEIETRLSVAAATSKLG